MGELRVFLKQEDIISRVQELAKKIAGDYKDGVHIVCVLKGAYVFCADLLRALNTLGAKNIEVDFLIAKSYQGEESSGDVRIEYFEGKVEEKDVLVVEDIVDTGLTVKQTREVLMSRGARSVKFCALLDKPSRREVEVKLAYIGFEIPNLYMVGYGLDLDEKYRDLPYIGVIE